MSSDRHERAMINYSRLAWLSHAAVQALHRDRFLVLTVAMACKAGWPEVAEFARGRLLEFSPHHQLSRFASAIEAMKSEDFTSLVARWERACPPEQAEHLLSLRVELAETFEITSGEALTPGEMALRDLSRITS